MIRIAICDDDACIVETIQQHLSEKDKELTDERLNISSYNSGEDFLRDIELGASFHIVFMDIQMDGIDGVDVGKRLRERPDGDDTLMIYVSSHNTYFEDLVQIGSFRFILKPIDKNALKETFSKALTQAIKFKRATETSILLRYKSFTDIQSIKTNSIVYLKSVMRTIEVNTLIAENKKLNTLGKFYSTVDEVIAQLPKDTFVRCERAHIVNLRFVSSMDKDAFVLMDKDSTRIPIGRVYKSESERIYFQYREGTI